MRINRFVGFTVFAVTLLFASTVCTGESIDPASPASALQIVRVEPTPLFPKPTETQPLKQLARLHLNNRGEPMAVVAKISVGRQAPHTQELGTVAKGKSTLTLSVPDFAATTRLSIELLTKDGRPLAAQQVDWRPVRKWTIYCVSSSHHDLGFGDYPHRLRTNIRHMNIERPLAFCRETDHWDNDSKFRFLIETSEPITSFLSSQSETVAAELGRRIREGRIQLGGLHSTVSTEQLGHELMARLFYQTNRHSRDLLGVPASRTAQNDDVIALTWPLATFCAEADVPYLFHGYNGCSVCMQPANREPVFFWQGPGGQHGKKILVRSYPYASDAIGDGKEDAIERIIAKFPQETWPYDVLLSQDGWDFTLITMENARKIHDWNAKWAYPRLVCATMDMFFDAVARQADPTKIKTFAKDGNNQWADQDATDAWLLGRARRADENVPTAEKFATIAQAVTGGGNSWTDIFQAYHRLLTYHEHTDAIFQVRPELELMRRYETEQEENREMVVEASQFAARAQSSALKRLTDSIHRDAERTLMVFNPLSRQRSDVVRVEAGSLAIGDRLVDAATGKQTPWQTMPDGSCLFVAQDVPSLGYRTYGVVKGGPQAMAAVGETVPTVLENRFYRVAFDSKTGTIASIRDKDLDVELVDQKSPHRFNEYLYERFETHDWKQPAAWHRVETARLQASSGPVADVMQVTAKATGAKKIVQTVLVYHDLKRIDFVLDLVKAPSGRRDNMTSDDPFGKESVYLALPFAVPDHQIRHELPGCVSQPVQDLFDGACTAFYAVRHFSDISNPRYGVTVSAAESSLIEYDHPRSCPQQSADNTPRTRGRFEHAKTPIATSRMYLYLMNNMFDVNIRWDQPGPVRFTYALRSHAGDWRQGETDQFGWDNMNPLIAVLATGKNKATLPSFGSFVTIDRANVACTTIKPAEANGAGFILRFVETQGRETNATVALPFLPPIVAATETNLVEVDRPNRLTVGDGNRVGLALRPFGVTTIRVNCAPAAVAISDAKAEAISDMEVALSWQTNPADSRNVSHYHVYRGTKPDFTPNLLNLVQRPTGMSCVDKPQLHYGGWINNRLEPATTYYYHIAAVDRWNNQGPISPAVSATTLKSSEKNMPPLGVECLRAISVSPLSRFNAVNLLWRTSCESDVRNYEVYRFTSPGGIPNPAARIAVVSAETVIKGGHEYGQTPLDHRAREYDHMMYLDQTMRPATAYYYRVVAVDEAGQKGLPSDEAAVPGSR